MLTQKLLRPDPRGRNRRRPAAIVKARTPADEAMTGLNILQFRSSEFASSKQGQPRSRRLVASELRKGVRNDGA